jgi:hypothetical protein
VKSLINSVIQKLFGKKIPKISKNYVPYVEEDTECDKCYKKNECIEKGYLVNSTFSEDTREHYIKGRGCVCIKVCEEFLEMKLSEILKTKEGERYEGFIRKAIDQLGDITFKELYIDKRYLEIKLR